MTNSKTKPAATESAQDDAVLEAERRSVVPLRWQRAYAKHEDKAMRGTCGDDVAARLREHTTGPDGKLDGAALRAVGAANGIDVDARWGQRNSGMQRMNLGNVLRGMAKRGETIVWPKATKKRKAK